MTYSQEFQDALRIPSNRDRTRVLTDLIILLNQDGLAIDS